MKLIKLAFENIRKFSETYPLVGNFKPLFEAMEEVFLGPGTVSSGDPHIHDSMDVKRFMSLVILMLIPATLASLYFYGPRVILMIMVSYICGGITEIAFSVIRQKPLHEGFLVTGLIFPLTLPPGTPLWMVAVGIVFGVFFGKEVFGGSFHNIFNPALVGRLFITIAFPSVLSTAWAVPGAYDAVTTATPLSIFKTTGQLTSLHDLWFGLAPGSIGETFRMGILLPGILLLLMRISDWKIPVFYLGTVFSFSTALHYFAPAAFPPAWFAVSTGGLMFGAFFMATDPVTAPITSVGKIVSAILCGVFTVLIRSFSGYVEGVMFSIVIVNGINPLLDDLVLGFTRRKRAYA